MYFSWHSPQKFKELAYIIFRVLYIFLDNYTKSYNASEVC